MRGWSYNVLYVYRRTTNDNDDDDDDKRHPIMWIKNDTSNQIKQHICPTEQNISIAVAKETYKKHTKRQKTYKKPSYHKEYARQLQVIPRTETRWTVRGNYTVSLFDEQRQAGIEERLLHV